MLFYLMYDNYLSVWYSLIVFILNAYADWMPYW